MDVFFLSIVFLTRKVAFTALMFSALDQVDKQQIQFHNFYCFCLDDNGIEVDSHDVFSLPH